MRKWSVRAVANGQVSAFLLQAGKLQNKIKTPKFKFNLSAFYEDNFGKGVYRTKFERSNW